MQHQTSRDSANRHGNALSRTTVESVDDTKVVQETGHRKFHDEQEDETEHLHPYGFTSVVQPPTGKGLLRQAAESVLSFLGSNRTHGVAIVTGDRRYRLYKLANGEVALHDDQGHQIHIKRDGIYISAPNSKKVHLQVMNDDTLPQDQKLAQIQQAGRPATPNSVLTKDEHTDTHPKQNTHQIVNGAAPPPSGGDVSSQLSGMVAQAQALVTAAVGLPGIQAIGSQIAGMGSAITGAGGSSSIATTITGLGTSMSTASMAGMSSLITSLMSQISNLAAALNPGGALSQVIHAHILDVAKGITHSAFTGNHTVKLGSDGIALTSIVKLASTAPTIPHNGQVYNSDSTFTTGNDFAAAFPLISDQRLKSNINEHPSVLDKIMSLKLKTFDVKRVNWDAGEVHSDPARSSLGVLAQDVQSLFPQIVHGDKFLAIEESKIGLLVMAAFQEFVIEMRKEIAGLKATHA